MKHKTLFLFLILMLSSFCFADVSNDLLFHVDYNNGVNDLVSGTVPIGVISGYESSGVDNTAVIFDRSKGDYLNYGSDLDFFDKLNDSTGFTLAVRTKINSYQVGTFSGIVGRYKIPDNERQFLISLDSTDPRGYVSADGGAVNRTDEPFSNNTVDVYHNFILMYNGTHVIQYTENSLTHTEQTDIYNANSSVPLYVGYFLDADGDNTFFYDGTIDHISFFDGEVDNSEINDLITFMETPVPGSGLPPIPPETIDGLDLNYTNSDGLDIQFDIYYNTTKKSPIVIIADSWGSPKDSYRTYVKQMRDEYGFIGAAINTRGKGESQGYRDAIGYECKDIYELAEHIKNNYAEYYDPSLGVHIMGFSAAGGKATVCSGRYPDYFTSVYATGGVVNLTRWYETAPADRPEMRIRTGNSVDPGVITYHPAGYSSVDGSVENQEAYSAREGALIGAYNTLSSVFISHYDNDPRVSVQNTYDYNNSWYALGKTQDYDIQICSGNTHSICNMTYGQSWINDHKGVLTLPDTGDLLIGGWVETKKFKIEFLEDVGYVGSVDYTLNSDTTFNFVINSLTYTGRAEVIVKEINANMKIYDNNVLVCEIVNNNIRNENYDYSPTLSNGQLSIILPSMSEHTVKGILLEDKVISAGYDMIDGLNVIIGFIGIIIITMVGSFIVQVIRGKVNDIKDLEKIAMFAVTIGVMCGIGVMLFIQFINT